jgi:hypothetical protein
MNLSDHPLLNPYLGKPAILDSSLLLFRWCSSFNPDLIARFKRLNSFQVEDIELLSETLKVFSEIRTTPHVLTEVSNLANSLPSWVKQDWSEYFSKQIQVTSEEWKPAAAIAKSQFMWLGLTDAALATLADSHVILTLDFPLSNALESVGLNAINFTHLRSLWLE